MGHTIHKPHNVAYARVVFSHTQGQQHANAKAKEAIDHLANFMSSRVKISQTGIELLASSVRFGYLSTTIVQ